VPGICNRDTVYFQRVSTSTAAVAAAAVLLIVLLLHYQNTPKHCQNRPSSALVSLPVPVPVPVPMAAAALDARIMHHHRCLRA
jgi:hypothetical protein